MDNSRLIAIACGLIVMLVIIMVFRGCMGKPDTSGLKKPQKSESAHTGISIRTGTPVTEPPELDIFGRPVTAVIETATEETTVETTTEVVETDILGNIVTATATATTETDISGNEITTVFSDTTTEVVTEENGEVPTEESEVTTGEVIEESTLSPIEQYEQDLKDPHSIGGFNHGNYDEEGNPVPTLPPDFTIIIN